MVDDFVSRKHGLTKVEYLLPELEELTAETLGVIVYQDQVLQIANRLAGYSLGDADLLAKGDGQEEARGDGHASGAFRYRCAPSEIFREAAAERIFGLMAEFAGYGFPKVSLHGLCPDHLPDGLPEGDTIRIEFMSALLTSETGNHGQGRAATSTSATRHGDRSARSRTMHSTPSCELYGRDGEGDPLRSRRH